MSPLPNVNETTSLQCVTVHHLSKRVNLNPFHYLTLPIKNNWNKVAPVLDKYSSYTRIVGILLGGLGLIAMLDTHKWKLPRWPWAKDGRNNPRPSYIHENEWCTTDELAEIKLMEMLKEMKMHEGVDDIPWGKAVPKETEDEAIREAEEQFMEDAEAGVEDVVEQM
jgi:hypothetical protein